MIHDLQIQTNIVQARTLHGIPPTRYQVPFRNIRDCLALHAKTSGRRPYLIYYDERGQRQELTYGEFTARVHQVANLLYDDLGLRRGDRVAVIGHNHPDVVLIYFACWVVGCAVAPQNVAEEDARIAYIIRNCEAKVAFVLGDYMERAERILRGGDGSEGQLGAPNVQGVIQVGGEPREGVVQFYEVVRSRPTSYLGDDSGAKDADMSVLEANPNTPTLEDDALIVYTSGTTGAPKGVLLSQYNLLIDAKGITEWQAISGGQRLMCVLPIHHVNGIVVTLVSPLYVGASVVLERRFSVHNFWLRIVQERVHVVSVVPTLLQFLLEASDDALRQGDTVFGGGINRLDLAHFRHIICGAGTLPVQLARTFEERFAYPILHGYGLSETTCYSCFLPITLSWTEHQRWLLDHDYPSIGVAIAPNEMAIFSADGSGQRLGPGERGEICMRGHNVMQGYYKRPEANAETFKFGWFRSGDEGFYLEDDRGRQFFFISGRIKELINRGGVKFSPFDIEETILRLEGVKVALAVGFENDYYGEEVGAYVVLREGALLTAQDVIDHCRRTMTFEKSPKVVIFGTDVPVTTTGKYQRLKLRDLFAEYKGVQFRK
ncbi:MAG: acyl--CoA ligase [Anaerolineae bacterium]|nr:acyl--CoA ligase [Anaerolineae bacterium]MDW8171263.1 class I adenylate-forming enzyme family protein [Anaerolineae bacterium]